MDITLYDNVFKISHQSCMITFHKDTCRTVLDRLGKILIKYPTSESISLRNSQICKPTDSYDMRKCYSGNTWSRYDIKRLINFLKFYTKDKEYIKNKDKDELKKELLTMNTFVLNNIATNLTEVQEVV